MNRLPQDSPDSGHAVHSHFTLQLGPIPHEPPPVIFSWMELIFNLRWF